MPANAGTVEVDVKANIIQPTRREKWKARRVHRRRVRFACRTARKAYFAEMRGRGASWFNAAGYAWFASRPIETMRGGAD